MGSVVGLLVGMLGMLVGSIVGELVGTVEGLFEGSNVGISLGTVILKNTAPIDNLRDLVNGSPTAVMEALLVLGLVGALVRAFDETGCLDGLLN